MENIDQFLIKRETLTSIADKFREYLPGACYTIDSSEFEVRDRNITRISLGDIPVLYYEFIDDPFGAGQGINEGTYEGEASAYGYRPNNNGIIVPVLFLNFYIDCENSYYYIDTVEINGEICDKWRRINENEGETDIYNWESTYERNIYTPHIVQVTDGTAQISPLDFPAKIDAVYIQGAGGASSNAPSEPEETTPTIDLTGTKWFFSCNDGNRNITGLSTLFPELSDANGEFIANVTFNTGVEGTKYTGFRIVNSGSTVSYRSEQSPFTVVYNIMQGWGDEAHKVIEITGGEDVTSPKLYTVLCHFFTQIPPVLSKTSITDLNGTRWLLENHHPFVSFDQRFKFKTGNTFFDRIYFSESDLGDGDTCVIGDYYDSTSSTYSKVYDDTEGHWSAQYFRDIRIMDVTALSSVAQTAIRNVLRDGGAILLSVT